MIIMWFEKKAEKKLKPRILSDKDEAVFDRFEDKTEELDEFLTEAMITETDADFKAAMVGVKQKQREANLTANMFSTKGLRKDAKSILNVNIELMLKEWKKKGY